MNDELIYSVSLEDFDEKVIEVSRAVPVLVDFWADWCSPCIVIAPVLQKVVEAYDGAVRLAKLEVDDGENMKLAGRYQVRGFPTIMLLVDGEEKGRFSGAKPAYEIEAFIDQFL